MQILFDQDIFLKTDYLVAYDSPDHINPYGGTQQDFTDGTAFALYLQELYPGRQTLIDLGTATGWVPLTMRKMGMLSVGLEGSDVAKNNKLGAWLWSPDIVRTCDISRPFDIIDKNNERFKFDFVTSWGVFEHIHPARMDILWGNVKNLMHFDSIGIFNIDCGENEWHQSGGVSQDEWQRRIELNFEILQELTFAANGEFRDHPYCRPTVTERQVAVDNHLPFYNGRTFWWVRLKK